MQWRSSIRQMCDEIWKLVYFKGPTSLNLEISNLNLGGNLNINADLNLGLVVEGKAPMCGMEP